MSENQICSEDVCYRDVIRIETNKDGLQGSTLKRKQLGFERYQIAGGAHVVRLGYKDSAGNMHYFTKDNEFASEYWKPSVSNNKDIYFNDTESVSNGKVAIGRQPDTSSPIPFEVRSVDSLNTDSQIRMSYNNDRAADIGVNSEGRFRIKVRFSEMMYLYKDNSGGNYKIHTFQSKFENNGNETEIWTDRDGYIKIRAGEQGLFLGAQNGDVIFEHSSATIGRIKYSESNEMVVAPENKAGSLRIKSQHYGNIILEPGTIPYSGVVLANDNNNVGKLSYTNIPNIPKEMLLETLVNNDNLRLKTGHSHSSGNIILEPGSGSGGVVLAKSGSPVAVLSSNTTDNHTKLEVLGGSGSFTIKTNSSDYGDIVLQTGAYSKVSFANGHIDYGKIYYSENSSEARFETWSDTNIRIAAGPESNTGGTGNVILQPGWDGSVLFRKAGYAAKLSYDHYSKTIQFYPDSAINQESLSLNNTAVAVKAGFLQLPVSNGIPAIPASGTPAEGYMYVNKNEKRVYLYMDGGWKTLYSWT